MIKLPKVKKTVGTGLTKIERVKKLVLAAALGTSLTVLGSAPQGSADLPNGPAAVRQLNPSANQGALLLTPAVTNADQQQMAQHYSHYSHRSHYSHSSHQSHYSHYSSRY